MLEKIHRINHLKECGYNTPKIMQINYGTKFDSYLLKRLKEFAASAKKMTVRTYSHRDEIKDFKTPFFPEISTDEAIRKVKTLSTKYHVLLQEAIDVNTTVITGNIALKKDGSGFYDILKGKYRVREVDRPPPGTQRISIAFNSIRNIQDNDMRSIANSLKDIPLLVPYKESVIVEFDLHNEFIGEKKELLIVWEYRPFA